MNRWRALRLLLGSAVGVCLLAAVVTAAGHDPTTLGPGTIDEPADNDTLVSVQGFHFQGEDNVKKPARLVSAGPEGDTQWRLPSGENATWFYDVDPLENGNVLVTSTVPGDTIVFEYDPDNDTRVWTQQLDAADTHDVDLINGDQLLVANMREYEDGVSDDRLFVYDLESDEITWEWTFREHYPNSTAGGFAEDWTHVNDVQKVGDGRYLASPRNFDQSIVIDRESGDVVRRLGEDGDHSTLYEQHNPDLLQRNGTDTMLVADSENDRVVEYTRMDNGSVPEDAYSTPAESGGQWVRTWEVDGFNWPRDADRLPNGNTLVVDTLHHRVVEITPAGEVVWEYHAPWAPYDAERIGTGDESSGPTIREQNATGSYTVHGGAEGGPANRRTPSETMLAAVDGLPGEERLSWVIKRWSHITPFVRPIWLSRWSFAFLTVGAAVAVPWGLAELVVHRRGVRRRLGALRDRAADRVGDRERAD
ncbi:arylsulfotransferase family protein [Halomicrobium urmianum]|uniref:arylsulfotransferase family protein n=1 Tax=Halomicrobium urmianum TaxID=1586233 RepID=UPI001CD970E6|nr:arylsulfotransferase family protein [Halomicrobium urmianum]